MLPPSMSIIDSINTNYINIALAKSGVTGCFSKTISRAATAKKNPLIFFLNKCGYEKLLEIIFSSLNPPLF